MKRVVVVDDEPITRMDLVGMLPELGFEVVGEASDGFDAIEACRAHKPDIVLMDVKMPIFDGLSAAETILQEELATCVVLLTAFCDKDIIWRANQIGVTGYLVKPIDARSILPTLEVAYSQSLRLVEQKKQTQEMRVRMQESRQIFRHRNIWRRPRAVLRQRHIKKCARPQWTSGCPLQHWRNGSWSRRQGQTRWRW